MENINLSVQVNISGQNGKKLEVTILKSTEDLCLSQMREILSKGISLLIKAEDGPVNQGTAIREVIEYLQEEFIDGNSFDNVYSNSKHK